MSSQEAEAFMPKESMSTQQAEHSMSQAKVYKPQLVRCKGQDHTVP